MRRLAFGFALLVGGSAAAHDFRPGVVVLRETGPGAFDLSWTPPIDSGAPTELEPRFPPACARTGGRLSCPAGLIGTIEFEGLRGQAVVLVRWRDGRTEERLATASAPRVVLGGQSGWLWVRVGLEHILTGLDHLAFVAGLLLLVGVTRRLVWAITAFTLAHSVTLALSAFDLLRLSAAPVEASIALSVVLVAREALSAEPTATRRWPHLVAGAFGLVHGLGFAGGLAELGLAPGAVVLPLAGFNLGIELGQLLAIAACLALLRLGGERLRAPALRRAACLGLGSLGAYWFFDRAAGIVTGAS